MELGSVVFIKKENKLGIVIGRLYTGTPTTPIFFVKDGEREDCGRFYNLDELFFCEMFDLAQVKSQRR